MEKIRRLEARARGLWHLLGSVSFRVKVMGIAVGSVMLLGLGVTLHMQAVMQQITDETLVRQGRALARWVATQSLELVLTDNGFALRRLLTETMQSEPSVRDIYIIAQDGRIVDHTFGSGFPRGLSLVNPLPPGSDGRWVKVDTNEGALWDIAVPVLPDGKVVAHVGVSPRSVEAIAAQVTLQHVMATGLVAGLALVLAFVVTGLPARAVQELVRVTEAVAAGQLGQRAQVWAEDELGKLALAFNSMSQKLAAAYQAMNRRNQQLALLNRMGMRLMGERDVSALLVSILGGGMALIGAAGGRIWMVEDGALEPAVAMGLDGDPPPELEEVARDAKPLLASSGGSRLMVPLALEGRVMGIMELSLHNGVDEEELALAELLGQQAALAVSNARLWADLKEKEAVRRHLLARAMTAQEEERRRIARELHDEASQSLSRLLLEIDRMVISGGNSERGLAQIRELAVSTLRQLQSLAVELRPTVLDEAGLVSAVARYLERFQERTGLSVDFHALGTDNLRLIPPVEIAIYRIVQEACLNVFRHAGASYISVLMERQGEDLLVIVEDDGAGFDLERVKGSPVEDRLGILGMEERANLIGASLTLESWPGSGTTVYLRVPLRGNTAGSTEVHKDSDR
jgi:signal transduction histidine kinase